MSIFLSFASEDRQYVDSFIREADKYKKIDLWVSHEEKIPVGKNFEVYIKENIRSSEGAILLVSENFLESDFVNNHELPLILEKANNDPQFKIAPVFIKESDYSSNMYLNNLHFVNSPSTSLSNVGARVYSDIVKETIGHFKSLNKRNPLLPILLGGILVAFVFGYYLMDTTLEDIGNTPILNTSEIAVSIPTEEEVENLSNADFAIIEELNEIPKRWNDEALIFVTAYMDPDVTWEEFLNVGWASYFGLLEIWGDGLILYGELETLEVEALYFPIFDNYGDKLVAIEKILNAVEAGDIEAELEAGEELADAAAKGQELACSMLEILDGPGYSQFITSNQKDTLKMSLASC